MTSVTGPLLVLQPQISIGPGIGTPLSDDLCERFSRAVVETHLHLPGMFELSFVGVSDEDLQQAGIILGARVSIAASATDPAPEVTLISGEITAMEGNFDDFTGVVTARGYDLSHRLQRVRRTRALLNTSDAEAAEKIASAAGLEIGEITPSDVIHDHLPQ